MAKLFPPIIEGTIPAFYSDRGVVKITIPFSLNRAVSRTQIKGIALKIKTVQSSSYLYTKEQNSDLYFDVEGSPWVQFEFEDTDNKLKVGQFYKLQIAFIDEQHTIGYYSTVGVSKYTTLPTISINDFSVDKINMHDQKYTGFYSQEDGDITEKVSSYRFDIYNSVNDIVYTSGESLHNSSNDVELYESYDTYELNADLPIDISYRIRYSVTTINGLKVSTPRYRIMQKASLKAEMQATLAVDMDKENGYINVNLVGIKDANGLETLATGAFLLSRSSEDSNYTEWNEISRFKLAAQPPSRRLWQDFTIEQGKNYRYSIQQYNDNGLYSDRILSNIVYADFEDAFLYDGEKQLCIKYNPKVTNFKADVLEAKMDTIGGSHPFIFRNGRTYYREFSISGLISYKVDTVGLFLNKSDYNFKGDTTNLTSENIAQEREFKMAVYKWLTNGEPKLFRSPSEGNFIVRLMNVSMAPNDVLGRMLHTFTATAYEIAEFTYNNLNDYDFIHLTDPEVARMRWETIMLNNLAESNEIVLREPKKLNNHPIEMVRLNDMMPGDKIAVVFESGDTQEIIIGVTGSYNIDVGVPIKSITLTEGSSLVGSMTYGYYSTQMNIFSKITNVVVSEVPMQQFIGEHDIIKELTYIQDDSGNWIKNPKVEVVKFLHISAQRRTRQNLTEVDDKYYQDKNNTIELDYDTADPFTLFQVGTWEKTEYSPVYSNYTFAVKEYLDVYNNKTYEDTCVDGVLTKKAYEPYIYINGNSVSVEDTRDFEFSNPGEISSLVCGNGVTVNVAYQLRNIEYSIEQTSYYVNLPEYNNFYQCALERYNEAVQKNYNYTQEELDARAKEVKSTYRQYILQLIEAQRLEKEAEGNL